jgi:hypothetical protein
MFYNFCRIHKTLKVAPAMAAGVTDKLWSMEDIVALIDARMSESKRNPPTDCKTGRPPRVMSQSAAPNPQADADRLETQQTKPLRRAVVTLDGQTHSNARHAVRIEPSLRPPSPENGNISACGQRLLAIGRPPTSRNMQATTFRKLSWTRI